MRAALLFLTLVFLGCVRPTIIATLDAGTAAQGLTLTGRVCTAPPDPNEFPNKVVLVFDQSGTMCVSDPPGSQQTNGFCQLIGGPGIPVEPARVRALRTLLTQFAQTNTPVALVPFEVNVTSPYPFPGSSSPRFAPADDPNLRNSIANLQSQLGKGTDLQGALAYAYSIIADDVTAMASSTPRLLPRSRYSVLLVTDGPPSPRCSSDDAMTTYADDSHPELTWADSTDYCNSASPQDPEGITGFIGGLSRNQNDQLFGFLSFAAGLKAQHGLNGIRLHTTLLFNEERIAECGPICQDIYGSHQRWPGPTSVPSQENATFAHVMARWLMRELAIRGGGTFSEFSDVAGIAGTRFTQLDFSSAAAPTMLKRFVVQPQRAVRFEGEWVVDSDGDGVPDELEVAQGTSPVVADDDSDGFDDGFELARRDAGFDPLIKDARGCDPVSALTPGCIVRDLDGDGLSQYAELYLGTEPMQEDTDRDGFPDGLEVRAGLDPRQALDSSTDTDADGITDAVELTRGSDLARADRTFGDQQGITTTIDEEVNSDGSVCHTFTTRNLPLVGTPGGPTTAEGLNLFKLWFVGVPRGVTGDVGSWKAACAWARKDGTPQVLDLQAELFQPLPSLVNLQTATCAGMPALDP